MILGILGPVGMLCVLGSMLIDMRRDAWLTSDRTSTNLLQVMERDIRRNIELYDMSLQAVVENLQVPGLSAMAPHLRQLILFDRAAAANDKGVMLVLDANGNVVEDLGVVPPRKGNFADREYFQVQKARADVGLFISKPLTSRLTGEPMIALSRRITNPDGSFGGVVVGTLLQSYFRRLFDQIGIGPNSSINVFLLDGTRVAQHPFNAADIGKSIGNTAVFSQIVQGGSGSLTGISIRDGRERRFTYTRIGALPLILDIAISVQEIDSSWRSKALVIGLASVFLCGFMIVLVVWTTVEARRRSAVQAELARLSMTDALTNLPNRRRFEDVYSRACEHSARTGAPLSLLVVDADHFKRLNDRLGHTAGDRVLQGLARCLQTATRDATHMVCRFGGEEFVLVLSNAGRHEALEVAGRVHSAIANHTDWPIGVGLGSVTVSIGVACTDDGDADRDLFSRADAALYEAKSRGRNQTCEAQRWITAQRPNGPLRVANG